MLVHKRITVGIVEYKRAPIGFLDFWPEMFDKNPLKVGAGK